MLAFSHDPWMVAASFAIALFAGFSGLSLLNGASRLSVAQRKLLVAVAAVVVGGASAILAEMGDGAVLGSLLGPGASDLLARVPRDRVRRGRSQGSCQPARGDSGALFSVDYAGLRRPHRLRGRPRRCRAPAYSPQTWPVKACVPAFFRTWSHC